MMCLSQYCFDEDFKAPETGNRIRKEKKSLM